MQVLKIKIFWNFSILIAVVAISMGVVSHYLSSKVMQSHDFILLTCNWSIPKFDLGCEKHRQI